MAAIKALPVETDEWLRRELRAIFRKQWEKVKTGIAGLGGAAYPRWKIHELANCRKAR
jgi:hypothetical protein